LPLNSKLINIEGTHSNMLSRVSLGPINK